ncbi:hypothetical protein Ddye_026169 [Dipteronia dyeriana]|uniref:Uncharacterized protein n=1 Tax=Dipteronia dyeriana TaxID=168575 RepID=A0AAD9WP96_9ROSI|nr:hypothetical protein Ddye_026166 [Dipteronia dyeriana]KAK2638374.1 hypothetical protein Ddye_026169 [Dipteronia dyeriana]
MNFNIGDLSNLSSSSSSSDEEEEEILATLGVMDVEEEQMLAQYGQFQQAMAQYLNQQNNPVPCGGSIPGHIVINRDWESVDRRLFYDYFTENPRYNDQMFRQRFRMGRSLFLHIVEKVEARDNYFIQRRDSVGRLGLSALQKITAVFRMSAEGCPADATDDYIKIGESTTIESLKRFYRVVVEEFTGQYAGRSRSPTIILEVVAAYDMWIWHAYFGLPGTNNDINVLEASHLFSNLTQGPARFWHKHILHDIMTMCIIMHNMIITDDRDVTASIEDHMEAPTPEVEMVLDENTRFQQSLAQHRGIRDKDAHIALRNTLIDHLWDEYTNSDN